VPEEDHSLAAGEFEGVRAGQERGTGAVIIWDEGAAEVIRNEPGYLSAVLHGGKLSGRFARTHTAADRWILVKARDGHARPGSDIVAEQPASVRTSETWKDLANEQPDDRPLDRRWRPGRDAASWWQFCAEFARV
jgi:bifunctional non-homologous end joining protein LigD